MLSLVSGRMTCLLFAIAAVMLAAQASGVPADDKLLVRSMAFLDPDVLLVFAIEPGAGGKLIDRPAWLYTFRPSVQEIHVLAQGKEVRPGYNCGVPNIWWSDCRLTYVLTSQGEAKCLMEQSATQHGGIIGAFPDKSFLLGWEERYRPARIPGLSVAAAYVGLGSWYPPGTTISCEYVLWNSQTLERVAGFPLQEGTLSIREVSPLFGENLDMFLAAGRVINEDSGMPWKLLLFSLNPFGILGECLAPGERVRFFRGRTPAEVVIGSRSGRGVSFCRATYDARDEIQPFRIEEFDTIPLPGDQVAHFEWRNGLKFFGAQGPNRIEIGAQGSSTPNGEVKLDNCDPSQFTVTDDGGTMIAWCGNRFSLWQVKLPNVLPVTAWRIVEEADNVLRVVADDNAEPGGRGGLPNRSDISTGTLIAGH